MLTVIKRNGDEVKFVKKKITDAISKANDNLNNDDLKISHYKIRKITNDICDYINKVTVEDSIHVEDIQNAVERKLIELGNYDLAKSYIVYRYQRSELRNLVTKVKARADGSISLNSNANVDEHTFSGREKEASADVSKTIALDFGGLSKITSKNHKDMLVYQHDLEKAIYGVHNCLFLNFQNMYKGFITRNTDVRNPSSLSSAMQLHAVGYQLQSQIQFGGVASMHVDYDLAPFVDASFKKIYIRNLFKDSIYFKEIDPTTLTQEEYDLKISAYQDKLLKRNHLNKNDITISNRKKLRTKIYKQSIFDLMIEGRQSAEALYHNLNTLESRSGSQVPFTSINLGRDTSPEGRLINQWIFEASLNGTGKNHKTSIFPISIFQYKDGVNAKEGDPNYDLKKLAIKSLTKRIYPNFVNCDWSQAHEDPNDIDTMMASMGCRTLVGYDINGLGYKRQGRGNAVPNTIILPKLGLKYGIVTGERTEPDIKGFWKEFEKVLQDTEKSLLERFNIMCKQSPKSAPFMYMNGTAVDTDKCVDNIYETLKHFTLAIGYVGVAEMCQALFGKDHADGDEEVYKFAYSVVKRINEYAKEATERNQLNFSCYATPAENLVRTALVSLRNQYGIIEGVTDREYLTNSHHVPVWKEISIYDKLRLEAPFTKFPTGGCITYIELDSMCMENEKAIEDIIDYAFKELDIPYLAFNFPIDYCDDCGYQGEIGEECPICKSKKIISLRRVTGYITLDYRNFNYGKFKETQERVKHSRFQSTDGGYPDYSFLDEFIKK